MTQAHKPTLFTVHGPKHHTASFGPANFGPVQTEIDLVRLLNKRGIHVHKLTAINTTVSPDGVISHEWIA